MSGTTHAETADRQPVGRPDGLTLTAFFACAILAGGNAVAVKLGFGELAPFWSGALRFLPASAILFIVMAVSRFGFPRGRALTGAVLYGVLNFGLTYLCGYWALREVSAGASMIVLSIVPLITLVLASAQRVERFRVRGLIGALLAAAGIAFIFWTGVSPASLGAWIAAFGGGVFMAQAPIVVKRFPEVHPVVENAIGMAIGGAILLAVSFALGEPHVIPTQTTTLLALAIPHRRRVDRRLRALPVRGQSLDGVRRVLHAAHRTAGDAGPRRNLFGRNGDVDDRRRRGDRADRRLCRCVRPPGTRAGRLVQRCADPGEGG